MIDSRSVFSQYSLGCLSYLNFYNNMELSFLDYIYHGKIPDLGSGSLNLPKYNEELSGFEDNKKPLESYL